MSWAKHWQIIWILFSLGLNAWSNDKKSVSAHCEYEFMDNSRHHRHRLQLHRENKERSHFQEGKQAIKNMVKSIKLFLSDSPNGHDKKLSQALGEWENQLVFADYYEQNHEPEKSNVLLAAPTAAWHLLRNILYTVGIRLPKATIKTTKKIIHATYDCFKV
jgi:hypothetical protein